MANFERILDSMAAIGLDEMDSVSLMNRVDTKYVFGRSQLALIMQRIADDYRVLEVDHYRQSQYSTLYFDTPVHTCYLEHHNGRLNRYKIRMRSYVDSSACFLEVKQKNNRGRTEKRRIAIEGLADELTTDSTAFIESVTGKVQGLVPQLRTNFSRITLVGRGSPERVTLDIDLQFDFEGRREQLPGVVIAEVKQKRDCRDSSVRQLLRDLRIRPLRVSKYCLGSILLKPHLKRNRFKSKLHKVLTVA